LAGLHVEEGIRLGKALQLVNIIRDVGADERNGRRYLPRQEADAAGGWPDEPAAMAPFARKLADPWMLTTARHLQAGRRHVARIRHMRLRFATTLPLVLAWETLSCIRQASAEDWWNGVKVSRRRVRQLLPTCLLRLGSPRWLDSWLARYERNWNPPPEPA
jgi:farnesyl-diphosphate farnesyltransferase